VDRGRLVGGVHRLAEAAGRAADHAFQEQIRPQRAVERRPVRERRRRGTSATGRDRAGDRPGAHRLAAAVLPAPAADGHVPEGASLGPVPAAALAEVARLAEAVVVVVAELGVGRVAARAAGRHLDVGPVPPVVEQRRRPPPRRRVGQRAAAVVAVGGQHPRHDDAAAALLAVRREEDDLGALGEARCR